MQHNRPNYYPFDVSQIEKGDYISPEDLQKVISTSDGSPVEIGTTEYRLGVLRIKNWIETELEIECRDMVLKCEQEGLRVLTDAEAEQYLRRKQALDLRAFERDHRKYTAKIDKTQLDAAQLEQHNSNSIKFGFILGELRRAKKKIALHPYKNTVPKMFNPGPDEETEIDA